VSAITQSVPLADVKPLPSRHCQCAWMEHAQHPPSVSTTSHSSPDRQRLAGPPHCPHAGRQPPNGEVLRRVRFKVHRRVITGSVPPTFSSATAAAAAEPKSAGATDNLDPSIPSSPRRTRSAGGWIQALSFARSGGLRPPLGPAHHQHFLPRAG
jgi:hypothetical protein